MVHNVKQTTGFDSHNDIFKRYPASRLERLIFLGIPAECLH